MKLSILALVTLLATLPLQAQETSPGEETLDEWSDATREAMEELFDRLRPQLEQLKDKIIDLSLYEAPEVLPNGDIIIRRKHPLPEPETESGPVTEPIDL